MEVNPSYRVGISGWIYSGWRGVFYPQGLPQRRELEYASRQVTSIEINGTFYSLQKPERYQVWYEQSPANFVYSVKGGRFITHLRRLREIRAPVANFFASGVLVLRHKLGPILWQFPPHFKYERSRFEEFFDLLPRDTIEASRLARAHDRWLKGRVFLDADARRPIRHAVEVRHASFECEDFYGLLRSRNIALVASDGAGLAPPTEQLTADYVYARLHGAKQRYESGYTDKSLKKWVGKFDAWASQGARQFFVYFDNDVKVMAPFDAVALLKLLDPAFEPAHPMARKPRLRRLKGREIYGPRVTRPAQTDRRWDIARKKAA